MSHHDKPTHQRWLYRLADNGIIKAIMIIWGICLMAIFGALLLIKAVLAYFK